MTKDVWRKFVALAPFGVHTGKDTVMAANMAILQWLSCIRLNKKVSGGSKFWTGVFAEYGILRAHRRGGRLCLGGK